MEKAQKRLDASRRHLQWDNAPTSWSKPLDTLACRPLVPVSKGQCTFQNVDIVVKEEQYNLTVYLFGTSEHGESICVTVHDFFPYFDLLIPPKADQTFLDALTKALKKLEKDVMHVKANDMKRIFGYTPDTQTGQPKVEKWARVYMRSSYTRRRLIRGLQDPSRLLQLLKEQYVFYVMPNIPKGCFEVAGEKLTTEMMFTISSKIVPSGWVTVPLAEQPSQRVSCCQLEVTAKFVEVQPVDRPDIAPLVTLSFDGECIPTGNHFPQYYNASDPLVQLGITFHVFGKGIVHRTVLCVGKTDPVDGVEILECTDEADLLNKFRSLVSHPSIDPDIVTGFNIFGFDLNYMGDRALRMQTFGAYRERTEELVAHWKQTKFVMHFHQVLDNMFHKKKDKDKKTQPFTDKQADKVREQMRILFDPSHKHVAKFERVKKGYLIHLTQVPGTTPVLELFWSFPNTIQEELDSYRTMLGQLLSWTSDWSDYQAPWGNRAPTVPEKVRMLNDYDEEADMWEGFLYFSTFCDRLDYHRCSRLRNETCVLKRVYLESAGMGSNELFRFDMNGRTTFDLYFFMRNKEKMNSYSLNSIAKKFLKNDTKVDLPYEEMFRLYRTGKGEARGKIALYCSKDCDLPLQIMDKAGTIPELVQMSRICYTPLPALVTRGQQIKVFSLIARYAEEQGFAMNFVAIPAPLTYVGATVIAPQAGYHRKPIATLDFASLYPSIMQSHNLCYSTVVFDDQKPLVLELEKKGLVVVERTVASNKEHWFVQKETFKGILPKLLKHLLTARRAVKKQMKQAKDDFTYQLLDGKQLALKVSCNSVYGFTGVTEKGMMGCWYIASTTTTIGRKMIEQTKEAVVSKYTKANGFIDDAEVVYGGTYFLFLVFFL